MQSTPGESSSWAKCEIIVVLLEIPLAYTVNL